MKGYWESYENRRNYLDNFAKEFQIREQVDWLRVKNQDISDRGGSGLLGRFEDSLLKVLKENYPEYNWGTVGH